MTPLTIENNVALVLIEPPFREQHQRAEVVIRETQPGVWHPMHSSKMSDARTCPYRVEQEVLVEGPCSSCDGSGCEDCNHECLVTYFSAVASISVRENKYWEIRF